MGQQQLLLLVLGIVIVGLAVVVGIQAFGENQKKANSDALVNDGVRIASDTQAWVLKPAAFGGGNGVPTNVTFASLGYTAPGEVYTNLNGVFEMDASADRVIISGENEQSSNYVKIGVFGTTPECIVTAIGSAEPTDPSAPDSCTTGRFAAASGT